MQGEVAVSIVLWLTLVAVPATAVQKNSCTVDVGAPLVSLEPSAAPRASDAIGGCTLTEDVTSPRS